MSLWERCHREDSISFLITRQVNQDPLQKFFGCIRQQGGKSDNPTPSQFKRAYRKLFHITLLSVVSGTCEDDNNNLLVNINHLEENKQILSNIISPPPIMVDSKE